MQFSGFIEALSRAKSTAEAFILLCETVVPLGWDRVAFFALTPEAQRALADSKDGSSPLLASNYPESYISRYIQERRYEIDPALLLARESLTPLLCQDTTHNLPLTEAQEALMIERRESGFHGEVACPIHGPAGQTFAIFFARARPGEWNGAVLSTLQVLAIHFYYTFARLVQASQQPTPAPAGLEESAQIDPVEAPALTQRERECLLWTARGKSASTISVILGLSENTINFYVKNAMKKLGTTNRVIAVVLAVRSGMIKP